MKLNFILSYFKGAHAPTMSLLKMIQLSSDESFHWWEFIECILYSDLLTSTPLRHLHSAEDLKLQNPLSPAWRWAGK